MILQTEGASVATRSMSTSVDGNGDFCFKVPPGVHTIQVIDQITCRLCLAVLYVMLRPLIHVNERYLAVLSSTRWF